jgi:HAD superfamily hydrolase (TIGR01509 family)
MQPSAVILDRDGVLTYFDVEKAQNFFQPLVPLSLMELAQRWQRWGKAVGFPSTIEQEQNFFAGFWQHLRQEYELAEAEYHTLVSCRYTDFMQCYAEVPEVLAELKVQGIAVGVLSNFSLATLEASLEAVGVRQWIDVACAATVIGYAKPQAEAYLHVANLLQVSPAACLFFDDEAPCVAGAATVGMNAFLVDRQGGPLTLAESLEQKVVRDLYAVLEVHKVLR